MNKENAITKENRLSQRDLEMVERVIYKNGDDIAVSIGRSFERLEERVDAMESRIYSRLGEIEDNLDDIKEEQHDTNKIIRK